MQCHHVAGHGLAGRVRIETAVNFTVVANQRVEPARVCPGAGRGYAQATWMKFKAADGVDGGFTQDNRRSAGSGYREVAEVPLGTGSHATPAHA